MFDYFYGAQSDQFSFYRVPKVMFTDPAFQNVSAEAKILYTQEEPAAETAVPAGVDPELLMKLLTNPEMAALLKTLAQTLK